MAISDPDIIETIQQARGQDEHGEPERELFDRPVIRTRNGYTFEPAVAERDDDGGWWFESSFMGGRRIVHIPGFAVDTEAFLPAEDE